MESLGALTLQDLSVLQQVLNEIPVPCFMVDRAHRVTVWNKSCEQTTGYLAPSMLNTRDAWRAFYPEKRPVLADLVVDGLLFQELQTHYAGQVRMSSFFDGVVEIDAFFPSMEIGRASCRERV